MQIKNIIHLGSLFLIGSLATAQVDNAQRMSQILSDRMCPLPKSVEFSEGESFKICDSAKVKIVTAADICKEAKDKISETFESYWKAEPEIDYSVESPLQDLALDAYNLSVNSGGLKISASDKSGVFQALKTLRQLAEPMRGTMQTQAYILPQCEIKDAPSMGFRGLHILIMPETKAFEIEKKVRLAAYYKFNYVVLEFWGSYLSKVRPEFNFENPDCTRSDIKNIVKVAKSLGITPIPQMTVFGHASGSMFRSGKHSTLDLNPQFAPLFEPSGWTWCLSNPNAKTVLEDMAFEMWELFDKPEFFHIGCDEAYDFATCADCMKANPKDLLKEHIMYFRDAFAKKGVRIMMWHDMLLEKLDPRWSKLTASARIDQGLKDLYKELPKDIVICCWEYSYIPKDTQTNIFESGKFFKDEGFDTLMCTWTSPKNTDAAGKFVSKSGLFGVMGTMWYHTFGEPMQKIYMQTAAAAWGSQRPNLEDTHNSFQRRLNFDRHIRHVVNDMGIEKMQETGRTENQEIPRFLY